MNKIESFVFWSKRILILLMVFVTIAALFHFIVLPVYVRKGAEVVVPDLIGSSISQADSIASNYRFKIIVNDERFDPLAPPGQILDQHPLPGQFAKRGRRLYLSISKGTATTKIPNLIGQTSEDALFTLQRAGLENIKVNYLFHESVFEGLVIAQDPEPDIMLPRNHEVFVEISLGKEPTQFIAPNLIGLQEDQAKYLVLKSGLIIKSIQYDKYLKQRDNTVIVQSPRAGTILEKGDSIELVINQQIELPDLTITEETNGKE